MKSHNISVFETQLDKRRTCKGRNIIVFIHLNLFVKSCGSRNRLLDTLKYPIQQTMSDTNVSYMFVSK